MLQLKLSDAEWFLIECIKHREHLNKERIRFLYESLGDANAYKLCSHNRILSIAADSLTCAGIELPEKWLSAFSEMEKKISDYMDELDKAAKLLSFHGIPMVALKNSGITRGLYPHYGACPMGDIDVLVRRHDFRRAHKLLTDNGYVMKFRSPLEEDNLQHAEQGGGAEYSVELPSGKHLWFELQWRPVAGRWIRPDQEPDATQLVDRSCVIKGSAARLLCPEDNLLQVALHTAKHSYVRAPGFRLHTDVDRIVRSSKINWNKFVAQVNQLQVRTPVFLSLAFAKELLGTPIPTEMLSKISPSSVKVKFLSRWLQNVGLFDPDGKKWGRFSYIFFVAFLYDDFKGLVKSVFPSVESINDYYSNKNKVLIPFLYARRLFTLLLKRTLVK